MTRMDIKKKLAMMFSVLMLTTSIAPLSLAEEAAAPSEGAGDARGQVEWIEPSGRENSRKQSQTNERENNNRETNEHESNRRETDKRETNERESNRREMNEPETKAVLAPDAVCSVSGDSITVTVIGEAGLRMYVDVEIDLNDDVRAGDTLTFTGFEAGKSYDIEVDYYEPQSGVSAYKTTVKIPAASSDDRNTARDSGNRGSSDRNSDDRNSNHWNSNDRNSDNRNRNDGHSGDRENGGKNSGNGAELITPPPSGNGNSGDVELITPPPSGSGNDGNVELITPPPSITELGAQVASGRDWIEVKVTEADNRPLYVAVGNDIRFVSVGETARFRDLAAGKYDIEVDYVNPVPGVSPFRSTVEIARSHAKDITFSATGGRGSIDVVVSDASTLPITVRLLQGGQEIQRQTIAGGMGRAAFEQLPAGVYAVSVNYDPQQWGVQERTQDNVVVTGAVKKIDIQSVSAGENVIAVTGSAQPDTDIALITTPQTSDAIIVRSDASGLFKAKIICPAGTYTQVKAVYVADNTIFDAADGIYIVTAPANKPGLTVDPVSNKTQKVLAKTTPGVTVNLRVKEFNYGQTLVADSRGLLQYSLPQTYPKGTVITFTVYYGTDNAQSYQETVTIGSSQTYNLLKYGDTGSDVKALTKRLEELGYLDDDTTRYSSAVRDAVRLFQEMNGLDVDGIAGQNTQTKLYSVGAIPYGKDAVYPTLVRGDRDMALIRRLQQRLKDLGYYTIAVDGIFGSGTERAVRDFQRINGLPKTGKADSATQQLLYSSSAKAADSAYADDYKTLSRSKYYQSAVVPLQRRLKTLGYAVGSVDGYFGSQTQRAVRDFQRRNGLSVTGIADETTQRKLYSSGAKPASGSSSSSSDSTGYRLLYWGCEGSDVKRLQNALLAAGYKEVRTADGIYGQWTYDAVRAFQKDHGLAVDGIAGKNTQNKLYGTSY